MAEVPSFQSVAFGDLFRSSIYSGASSVVVAVTRARPFPYLLILDCSFDAQHAEISNLDGNLSFFQYCALSDSKFQLQIFPGLLMSVRNHKEDECCTIADGCSRTADWNSPA